jgi:DNA-binding transcriptional regulator YiaG
MADDTVYMRTMRRALATAGSREDLAAALRVSVAEIDAWTDGSATPPPGVFLRAIDIVANPPFALPKPGKARTG